MNNTPYVDTIKLLRAVRDEINKAGFSASASRCNQPTCEELIGNKYASERGVEGEICELPTLIGVKTDKFDKAHCITIGRDDLYLQMIQLISYTKSYEHPYVHAIFMKPYKSFPVLIELGTYRVISNSIVTVYKNMR